MKIENDMDNKTNFEANERENSLQKNEGEWHKNSSKLIIKQERSGKQI